MGAAAMASSRETEETDPLVGVGPSPSAPDAKGPRAAASSTEVEARIRAMRAAAAEARKKMLLPRPPRPAAGPFRRLARLWRRFFVRFDPDSIPVCEPLDAEQIEMLERHMTPGYFKRLAWDRQLVTECLHHYNSMHPGNEYEPAPGKVSQHPHFHNGICWTHGNFVARKKRSGCFSFLPAPRTLFFFELAYRNGSNGVVTCTALEISYVFRFQTDQLLKPTVSWVSLFGGMHVVLAYLILFARRATVALMFHVLARGRHLRVDMTMWRKSVKCAIAAPMCCIQTVENLHLAITILTTPTLLSTDIIDHCDGKLTS